jgi:hypothetical protein
VLARGAPSVASPSPSDGRRDVGVNAVKPRLLAAADQRQHVAVQQAAVTRQLAHPRIAAVLGRVLGLAEFLNLDRARLNVPGDLEALERGELRLPAANVGRPSPETYVSAAM